MVVVEEGQSGTGVDVPTDALLAIRLRENPGTGFRWSVESADGLAVEENVDRGALPGAAGLHEFRFRAPAPGSHHLRLKHWRDWEGEASVIGRFVIDARFV
jgi:inhibitor of cysteine peptidase